MCYYNAMLCLCIAHRGAEDLKKISKSNKQWVYYERERQVVFAKCVGCTAVLCGALYTGLGDWYELCSAVLNVSHGCPWSG